MLVELGLFHLINHHQIHPVFEGLQGRSHRLVFVHVLGADFALPHLDLALFSSSLDLSGRKYPQKLAIMLSLAKAFDLITDHAIDQVSQSETTITTVVPPFRGQRNRQSAKSGFRLPSALPVISILKAPSP